MEFLRGFARGLTVVGVSALAVGGEVALAATSYKPVATLSVAERSALNNLSTVGLCSTTATVVLPCGNSGKKYPTLTTKQFKKLSSGTRAALLAALIEVKALNAKLKLRGLAVLPAAGTLAKGSTVGDARLRSLAASNHKIGARAVSGTPPTLTEIAEGDPATIFWAPGVVDGIAGGSPSQNQCDDFFGGMVSGGYGSCFMAQNVGQSLEPVLRSGSSACYMKGIATTAIGASGAITLTKGRYPGGSIENLFKSSGSSRLIKITPLGMTGPSSTDDMNIFIRIPSLSENERAGNRYKYQLYQCVGGAAHPYTVESATVKINGEYNFAVAEDGDHGLFASTVTAYLVGSGNDVIFDPDQGRTVTIANVGDAMSFKAFLTVNSDTLRVKQYAVESGNTRRSYTVSQFSGDTIGKLRFYAGAFKEHHPNEGSGGFSFSGATEWQDTFYAAATGSSYAAEVDGKNFDADSFYSSSPTVSFNANSINCSTTPDIALTLDMAADAVAPVRAECDGERLDGMSFCYTSALQSAQEQYFQQCLPQQP